MRGDGVCILFLFGYFLYPFIVVCVMLRVDLIFGSNTTIVQALTVLQPCCGNGALKLKSGTSETVSIL